MYRSFRLTYRSQLVRGNSGLNCWEGRNLYKKSEAPRVTVSICMDPSEVGILGKCIEVDTMTGIPG